MPYEGEYAQYRPLKQIVESDRVKQLLARSRVLERPRLQEEVIPKVPPLTEDPLPGIVLAIDGSIAEVDVKNGYPGAKVGYCSVASVIMNLAAMDEMDKLRPVDPVLFRTTESPSSEAAAMPGCNVITRDHVSAKDSFREAVFDLVHDLVVDEDDHVAFLETFQVLLASKPTQEISCPYVHLGCTEKVAIGGNLASCTCDRRKPLYPTDALRIHERFNDEAGTNGEAFAYVMQIWERMLLVHLLRCFERRGWLGQVKDIAFFLDGPLAVFGPPAWMSASISRELRRINALVRNETGTDMLIIGVEKTGNFVTHFDELDKREDGAEHFPPGTFCLLTDEYIKRSIIYSDSDKRYGADTYFGRKFFYKTKSRARIVASIAFLTPEQDTLETDDLTAYPRFSTVCTLLDKLATSRYANALAPIVSAHANAAIPLHLGQKVLKQLAQVLMRPTTA